MDLGEELERWSAEQDWKNTMESVIKSIELFCADRLIEGITPTVLLGEFKTVNDLKKYYFGDVEVDFKKGVAFTFGLKGEDPKEDGIILVVYRTTDLNYGQVVII